MNEERQEKFTDEDEKLLRQAMRFLKNRELMEEPCYWEDDDDI